MYRVIVFAGTTEGRELAQFLSRHQVRAHVCVATEYGGELLGENEYRTVSAKRLTKEEMKALFAQAHSALLVVDATHPYAAEVSQNIKAACEETGAEYVRLLRASESAGDADLITVATVEEAVAYLQHTDGNILVTTGSKELDKFTALDDYQERVFARILSTPEAVADSAKLGFTGKHLICMQGPFSEEMNTAMLRQFDARYLVTKESGKTGGFGEKIRAARAAGAKVVLIGRPCREEGLTPLQVRYYLARKLDIAPRRRIYIVGTGMGTPESLTAQALALCRKAQLLVGAERILEPFRSLGKDELVSYQPQEIYDYLQAHPEYETVALLQSGDVGFYSGAKRLLEVFAKEDVVVCPGISSVVYFCAKLHKTWEDARLLSLHGREVNIIGEIRRHRKVFALMGAGGVTQLLQNMAEYGLGHLTVSVGENLSYPTERIRTGVAVQLAQETFSKLCVVLVENPAADQTVSHGLEDTAFLRDQTPMTKSEVRSISLSKLRLRRDSVVYDVGAGSGSVSVEAALLAAEGVVYAIEKKPQAAALIKENKRRFAAGNLRIVEGTAPEALRDLPAPTHVFIGGSSGNLKSIMTAVLEKNPAVRIVINCIALETVAEAMDCLKTLPLTDIDVASVSIGKAKELGNYHMMMGQNPVYVISCSGGGIA